jgi:outer membrane receptor protein involved in Fe transport
MYANFVIKDLQRVEVLRGPQGTLYGSGSLGGTVRYITNKPSTEAFAGEVMADFSQTEGSDGDNLNFNAMFNVPLGDRAAIRAHAGRIDNDGVIDYINAYQLNSFGEALINDGGSCIDPRGATNSQIVNNGACYRNAKDADTVEIDYARIALKVDATEDLSFTFAYQTQDDEVGARRSVTEGDNGQPVGSDLYFNYGDHESGRVILEPSEREANLMSLDVEWDMGFATLTSNSSWIDTDGQDTSDNAGLWVSGGGGVRGSNDWVDLWYQGWARPIQRAERGYDNETFVQELRLVSNSSDSTVDWMVGAFYLDQEQDVWQKSYNPGMNLHNDACQALGACAAGFWPQWYSGLTEIDFDYQREEEFEEKAVYGELTYHASDRLHLTGGFRWFDNETVNNTKLGFPLVIGWSTPYAPESTKSDDGVLIKLNASYDLSDERMVYATYSQGYRRGGAQAVPSADDGDSFGEPNAAAIRDFDKDEVDNYEIGLKGKTDKFSYTVSAFYVDWQDTLLNYSSVWYGFYLAGNGDSAETYGIEAEIDGYLSDTVHYRLGYTHVTAELADDFISPQTGSVVAKDGTELSGSPENVLSASLDKTWTLGSGSTVVGRVSAYYQSDSNNYIDDQTISDWNTTIDSFWLLNASATLNMDDWQITLYGKNLADEDGTTGAFPSDQWSYDTGVFENNYGNGNAQFISQPRTIGLSARYSF